MTVTEMSLPVSGGRLTIALDDGDRPPTLAVHGISSQRKLWNWLRAEAPDIRLLTPDLRGRGGSVQVGPPFSTRQHVEDLVAVLDGLELPTVDVCGMSMGGFVAVALAVAHPERVSSLVLVDGGFPMATPPGLTREMLPRLFADRLARLDHAWPSLAEYRDFFVTNTAPLLDCDDPLLADYLAYDLVDGKVRLAAEAVLDDSADIFFGPDLTGQLTVPVRFLYAEFSVGQGSAPAYSTERVAEYRTRCVASDLMVGLDHAGTIMTRRGAAQVAQMLRS